MGIKSGIEWTDSTLNPVRARRVSDGVKGFYCEKLTAGCANCYSERMNLRLGTGFKFKPGHLKNKDIELFLDEEMLLRPLRWKRRRVIFICSTTDLFADFVPDEWIDKHFAMMALAHQHFFLILTKRSERMRLYMKALSPNLYRIQRAMDALGLEKHSFDPCPRGWPFPNVGFGVSVENQDTIGRVSDLLRIPAALHFISAEPLLGPLNLTEVPVPDDCAGKYAGHGHTFNALRAENDLTLFNAPNHVGWVIAGGESGPDARPVHPDWVRSLQRQCFEAEVPFNFKQWGEWHPDALLYTTPQGEHPPANMKIGKKKSGRLLDGKLYDEFPEVLTYDPTC